MAKLAQLVTALAGVTGTPEGAVTLLARQMREAGMVSSGGRGPGGAEMTHQDCANMLLALVSRDREVSVPARVADYRRALGQYRGGAHAWDGVKNEDGSFTETRRSTTPDIFKFLEDDGPNFTLGSALESLFEIAESGELTAFMVDGVKKATGLDFDDAIMATVRLGALCSVNLHFFPAAYQASISVHLNAKCVIETKFWCPDDLLETAWRNHGDLKVSVDLGHLTLLKVGDLLANRSTESAK